jgi:uncharacterized lipoprotein YmbA
MKLTQPISRSVAALFLLFLAGCGSLEVLEPRADTSQFYVFDHPAANVETAPEGQHPSIAIGPSTLARHLDQPQIVRYSGNNKVAYSERDRWAEPLEDNINRVLVLCLGNELGTSRIGLLRMMGGTQTDYRVGYHVYRFGSREDESVDLQVAWWIESLTGERLHFTEQSYTIPGGGPENTSDYVKALQQVVVKWATDMAGKIQAFERESNP